MDRRLEFVYFIDSVVIITSVVVVGKKEQFLSISQLEKKEHWIVLLRSAVINQIVGLARQEILVEKFKKCAHNRT